MKTIDTLRWKSKWTSLLGCLKACLDYLSLDISDAWLYGGTGHAFVMNIHERVCPSGPTAWKMDMLYKLGENLGYTIDKVEGFKNRKDFEDIQRKAWNRVRAAIDEGFPCYGWELEIPEYYVVHGYDDQGYLYNGPGCNFGRGSKPWQELGDTGIGVLEMFVVRPDEPADDDVVVREALEFALCLAKDPGPWVFKPYEMGLAAYDLWVHAVDQGTAIGMGMAYNAAVWADCRVMAAQFLKEAGDRLNGRCSDLFDEAVQHYETVADCLKNVADLFPFMNVSEREKDRNVRDGVRCRKGTEHLLTAKAAEESGLSVLEKLIANL